MTIVNVPGFGTVSVRLSAGHPEETNGRWRGDDTPYTVLTVAGKDVGAAGDYVFSSGKGTDTEKAWRAGPVGTRTDPAMPGTPTEMRAIETAVLAAFETDLGEGSPEMLKSEEEGRQNEVGRLRRQVESMGESVQKKKRKIRDLEGE